MFRKFALALAATSAIAAAALTPTAASAHWHGGHHWGDGYGFGFYGPTYISGPDCYTVKKQVLLSNGSVRWRRFTVCN
jgi:hypothetical protein